MFFPACMCLTSSPQPNTRFCKRGSPYLWQAIWFAANRAEFCDSILSKYYQLLKARGKHHLTAVGAVTRKLCDMIFTILRKTDPMNRRRQRREIKAYENIDSQRLSQKER